MESTYGKRYNGMSENAQVMSSLAFLNSSKNNQLLKEVTYLISKCNLLQQQLQLVILMPCVFFSQNKQFKGKNFTDTCCLWVKVCNDIVFRQNIFIYQEA